VSNNEGSDDDASQGSKDSDTDKELAKAMKSHATWSHINDGDLLPVMYKAKQKVTTENDDRFIEDETVYRYSHLWMPKSIKKKQKMIAFNNKVIESAVVKELAENAAEAREKKRQIKSEWKKCI
jgi:hypothetical protein